MTRRIAALLDLPSCSSGERERGIERKRVCIGWKPSGCLPWRHTHLYVEKRLGNIGLLSVVSDALPCYYYCCTIGRNGRCTLPPRDIVKLMCEGRITLFPDTEGMHVPLTLILNDQRGGIGTTPLTLVSTEMWILSEGILMPFLLLPYAFRWRKERIEG